jgi:RimJ/RimL family protein N-acetyltransferase
VIDTSFEKIAGDVVTLRRFRASDASALRDYRSDREVARYQGYDGCTLEQAQRLIAKWEALSPGTPGEWFPFAVNLLGSQELIGDCALRSDPDDPRLAEMGFSFGRENQRKGLASAAVRAVLEYSFTRLALHRVRAITDERNGPAQRMLERVGFREEGRFVRNVWFKGEWSSERLYAYLQEDWRPD